MKKEYKVMGTAGNLVIDKPVESKMLHIFAHMIFIEYVKDETGTVCGVKFIIDEGTWDEGSFTVRVKVRNGEDI